jgi:lysophospholipid hydrolase
MAIAFSTVRFDLFITVIQAIENALEVGSGGTLSSLFTILSLFTEDVHMSWHNGEEEHPEISKALVPILGRSLTRQTLFRTDSEVPQFNLDHQSSRKQWRDRSNSDLLESGPSSPATIRSPPPHITNETYSARSSASENITRSSSVRSHGDEILDETQEQGTVARAVEDSTLAVIPAEAFRRLTKKFPKATAHIVQGSSSHSYCKFWQC